MCLDRTSFSADYAVKEVWFRMENIFSLFLINDPLRVREQRLPFHIRLAAVCDNYEQWKVLQSCIDHCP
jgi:hypothetical protein